MMRQVVHALAVGLFLSTVAQATVIVTVGDYLFEPGNAYTIDITLTTDEDYTATNMRTFISTGGPLISHVFNAASGVIPAGNLSGSIWATGAIAESPNGTSFTSTGQRTYAGFATSDFLPAQADGIYATLTLSTVGVGPGMYILSLVGHPDGATEVFGALDPEGIDALPVSELILINGTLTVTPEPTSIVLGLFAALALAGLAVPRRRPGTHGDSKITRTH